MLTNFISEATKAISTPVFELERKEPLDIKTETAIRINVRSIPVEIGDTEILERARMIYFRAKRSHRLSRAAAIF